MNAIVRAADQPGILVVDSNRETAASLQDLLRRDGYLSEAAFCARDALRLCDQNPAFGLVLVDFGMPFAEALSLVEELHRRNPLMPIVLLTKLGVVSKAVEALQLGAEDYLVKPFSREAIRKKVAQLMEVHRLRQRISHLEENLQDRRNAFEPVIFVSRQMHRVVESAQAACAADAPLLLLGESGTGKELLARAIHRGSPRADRPLAVIDCRGLSLCPAAPAANSEFAGLAAAAGGTVYLNEIGELSRPAQAGILSLLQEVDGLPPRSTSTARLDLRIMSASSRPLHALRAECLSDDFYLHIATVVLRIAPLRERPEDILVLAQHFLGRLSEKHRRQIALSRSAIELLVKYPFPGNVAELEALMETVTARARNQQLITDKELKPLLRDALAQSSGGASSKAPLDMEDLERMAVERALRVCDGNRTRAARLLGISRDTLYRRLKEAKTAG